MQLVFDSTEGQTPEPESVWFDLPTPARVAIYVNATPAPEERWPIQIAGVRPADILARCA